MSVREPVAFRFRHAFVFLPTLETSEHLNGRIRRWGVFFPFRRPIAFVFQRHPLADNMHSIALTGVVEAELVVLVLFIEVIAADVLLESTFDLQLP